MELSSELALSPPSFNQYSPVPQHSKEDDHHSPRRNKEEDGHTPKSTLFHLDSSSSLPHFATKHPPTGITSNRLAEAAGFEKLIKKDESDSRSESLSDDEASQDRRIHVSPFVGFAGEVSSNALPAPLSTRFEKQSHGQSSDGELRAVVGVRRVRFGEAVTSSLGTRKISEYTFTEYTFRTCGYFKPLNPVRKVADAAQENAIFRWVIVALIVLSCVSGVVLESVATSDQVKRIFQITEYVMFAIFVADISLAMISKGLWTTPEAYFRSKSNVTDVGVILLSFVSLFLGGKTLSVLRVFRAVRPLMAMRHFSGVRSILLSLRSATRLLVLNAILILLVMVIFVGTGVDFYRNSLSRECHIALDRRKPNELSLVFPRTLCKNGTDQFGLDISTACPIGQCRVTAPEYRFNLKTFDFFHSGLVSVLQIATLDRWSEYMFPLMASELFIFSGVWFVSLVATITLILLTLFTGVTTGTFSRIRELFEQSGFLRKEAKRVDNLDYTSIFKPQANNKPLKSILKKNTAVLRPGLLETVEKDHVEKVGEWDALDLPEEFEPVEFGFDRERKYSQTSSSSKSVEDYGSDAGSEMAADGSLAGSGENSDIDTREEFLKKRRSYWRRELGSVVESSKFMKFIVLCVLVNIAFQALEHEGMSVRLSNTMDVLDYVFAVIFTIELLMRILAFGIKVLRDPWVRLDIIIVIAAWASIASEKIGFAFFNISALRALRALRIVRVLHFFADFFFILRAAVKSLRATGNVMLLTLIIITVYGMLGFALLRDTYTRLYETRHHFDSFAVGMVTLFVISTGDRWTDSLYQSVSYNGWCSLFFISFYVLVAWIIYSLYIALVLENFAMSENEAGLYRDTVAETRQNMIELLDKISVKLKTLPIFEHAGNALRERVGQYFESAEDDKESETAASLSSMASSNWKSVASGETRVSRSSQGSLKSQANLFLRDPFDLPSQLYYYYLQHLSTTNHQRRGRLRGKLTKDRNLKEIKNGLLRDSQLFGCKVLRVPRFILDSGVALPEANSLSGVASEAVPQGSDSVARRLSRMSGSSLESSSREPGVAVVAMTPSAVESADGETPRSGPYVNVLRRGSMTSAYTPISSKLSKVKEGEVLMLDPEAEKMRTQKKLSSRFFRTLSRRIVGTLLFEIFMTGVVVASVVILTDDPPAEADSRLNAQSKKWLWWEITSLCIFTAEAILKIFAFRFIEGKYSYMRDPWNVLDFIILMFAYLSLILPLTQALRLLRVAKPLRFLRRIESVRFVVKAIIDAVPNLFQVCLVQIYILFLFAMMGVSLFRGRYAGCNDTTAEGLRDCRLTYRVGALENPPILILSPRAWERSKMHCDHIGACMLMLAQVATCDDWSKLMFAATDIRGRGLQPREWSNPTAAAFFIIFVIIVYLFMNNIFISVVIFNLSKHRYSLFKTGPQKMWINFKRQLTNQLPIKNLTFKSTSRVSNVCRVIVSSTDYGILTSVVVLFGVGFTIFTQSIRWDDEEPIPTLITVVEVLYCAFFTGDAILKIVAYTFSVYWQFNTNKFDFCITMMNIIMTVTYVLQFSRQAPYIAVVRFTRVIRVLYIPRIIQGMDYLLDTLIISIPTLFNSIIVMAVIFSTYAFIAKLFLASIKFQFHLSRDVNYRRYASAVFRLFVDFTQDGWADFMNDLRVQPPFCTQTASFNDCGTEWAILYTCSFIVTMVYVLLNIIFAVILDTFEQCFVPVDNLIGTTHVEEFKKLWSLYDPHAVGILPKWRMAHLCQQLHYHHNALAISPLLDRYHFHVFLYHLFRQGGVGNAFQFHNVLRTLTVNSVKHDCFVSSELRELLSLDRRADLELAQIQIAALWKTYWAYCKLVKGRNEIIRSHAGIARALKARSMVRAMRDAARKNINDNKHEQLLLPFEDWTKIIHGKLHFYRMRNEDLFNTKQRSREAGIVVDLTSTLVGKEYN